MCSYRLTSGRGCRRLTRETRRAAAPCPTPTARGSCRRQPPDDPPAWGDRRMSPLANSAMPTWRACGVAGEVRRNRAGATPHRRGPGGHGLWATELGLSASRGSGWTAAAVRARSRPGSGRLSSWLLRAGRRPGGGTRAAVRIPLPLYTRARRGAAPAAARRRTKTTDSLAPQWSLLCAALPSPRFLACFLSALNRLGTFLIERKWFNIEQFRQ